MAEETKKLTTKQAKAIPIVLAARSYEQGMEAAGISKGCFYTWMKCDHFRQEFERQRNELAEAAFGAIAMNVEKAATALVGLLDSQDTRLRRLVANDLVNHWLKHKELHELESRIEAIERRIQGTP